jgi:putative SOS response-associated peptidase YedK
MCGRYYRRSDKQKIAEAFHIRVDLARVTLDTADYNVAPTTFQPVIRNDKETGERELVLMRWGLVPHFTKKLSDVKGVSTINARAESIMKTGMWRVPFQRRRCLVPADGFYEWKKLDPKTKQPYAFAIADGEPFAFAGLWDAWKDPKGGGWLQSYSIITTEANELMEPVHNRMPVILKPADYTRWLARDPRSTQGLGHGDLPIDLLRPYDADAMKAAPCNPKVGNVRNNGPEMLNSA